MESKKRSVGASERDGFLRAAWRTLVADEIDAGRFVFVDECSTNTSMRSLHAWSRLGERAFCSAPRNWGKNITLISSLSPLGMGPSVAVEGSTTRVAFEAYLEEALCPSLSVGQVVVMDNLSAHKGEKVRELIEERGCELIYLPPYSPDYNPIEQAFSKMKALMRKSGARTREALIRAMGEALSAITARDASGFFRYCGYRTLDQLP